MQENGYKPVMGLAQLSKVMGIIFCIAGVLTTIGIINAKLPGLIGFSMSLSQSIPTLAGGLLLIVAGEILHVVTDISNAQAEPILGGDWVAPGCLSPGASLRVPGVQRFNEAGDKV